MSDLRVWVDGVEWVVWGVYEDIICENILFVFVNVIGKLGRFVLFEKWCDFERILLWEVKFIKCL